MQPNSIVNASRSTTHLCGSGIAHRKSETYVKLAEADDHEHEPASASHHKRNANMFITLKKHSGGSWKCG